MIEGTKVANSFERIYASSFYYDRNVAVWPAQVVNYTNKTQFIYRINKGILNVVDDSVNDSMPHEDRPVPMTNMIYIGDSGTDIPCMRLVMKSGGYSIGIFQQDNKSREYLKKLLSQNRINYIVESDYSKNSELENVVKEIIQAVKHKDNLKNFTKKHKENI